MEVEILHRHDLRVAAAGRASLDAEDRAERRLAQAEDAFCSIAAKPCASETAVVVFPSPAGVGVIAVTAISLPSGAPRGGRGRRGSTFAL